MVITQTMCIQRAKIVLEAPRLAQNGSATWDAIGTLQAGRTAESSSQHAYRSKVCTANPFSLDIYSISPWLGSKRRDAGISSLATRCRHLVALLPGQVAPPVNGELLTCRVCSLARNWQSADFSCRHEHLLSNSLRVPKLAMMLIF